MRLVGVVEEFGDRGRNGGGKAVQVRRLRETVQEIVDVDHSPADPRRHPAVRLPVLPQALPPEIRHEKAHLRPHR